jgi:ribosomal protein S12 methylthiotransferase
VKQLPIVDLAGTAQGGEARAAAPGAASRGAASQVAGACRGTFAFVSLGCPKNLVDSEKMLGHLAVEGYVPVSDPNGADFVIVNTCGFIDASRAESKAVIREMLELKRQGRTGAVIVAGCLPERVGAGALFDELPGIDHVMGVFARDEVARAAEMLLQGRGAAARDAHNQRMLFRPAPLRALDDRARLRITPAHYAYLKISEGCNRTCTFCSIPMIRGKHVSKPIELVVAEAEELVSDGARELNIVAQDTTYYGIDLYGKPRLSELLGRLEEVEGLKWIRLLYLYPEHVDDALIERIAGSAKILPYLDMPLQHINDQVLKRMQRRVNKARTIELVQKLRERIANLVLRTTFIAGFPGETEEQFEELREFVAKSRFERMGVFTYSLESGTPAVKLDGHLPEEVKALRRDALMEQQQQVAFAFGDGLVGCELDVLIDDQVDEQTWVGRSYADAPEIDGAVYVRGQGLAAGSFVPAEILARQDYDLLAAASSG